MQTILSQNLASIYYTEKGAWWQLYCMLLRHIAGVKTFEYFAPARFSKGDTRMLWYLKKIECLRWRIESRRTNN